MKKIIKYILLFASVELSIFNTSQLQAAEPASTASWHHSVTIYAWLPSIDGELKYKLEGDDPLPIDASRILDSLNMTFMGTYEARKEKWLILGDVIYLDLGEKKNRDIRLYNKVELNLNGWQLGLYGGHNLYQTSSSSLYLLAGLRYLSIETEANLTSNIFSPLNLSQDTDLWDGVIGLRGNTKINENWYIPYHADIGTGDSDMTWQAMIGIGYHASWGDTILAYRHLEWDQGDDDLLQNLSFYGPGIAFKFHF